MADYQTPFKRKTIFPHRYSKCFYSFWWSKTALWESLIRRLKDEKDAMVLISGDTGCLSGDTVVKISRVKATKEWTLRQLYEKLQGIQPKINNRRPFDKTIPLFIRTFKGKEINLHRIKKVLYSGKKEVYELSLKNGLKIKGTADHKIRTREGWVELKKLKKKDLVMCDTPNAYSKKRKTIKLRDIGFNYSNFSQGEPKFSEVEKIVYRGFEDTYDICCEEPYHNFVANNIVVHNSGKSHFTANMCFNFGERTDNFVLNDGTKMFNAEENFIISPEEFAYKMISKEGQLIWGDEFRRGANRRDWYSPINKAILDRKNTNRKLFNIYFLCMPYEAEFDPKLASHLHMWIWIRRGVGEVYVKRSGIKGGRGLDIPEILDREAKYLKENPKKSFVPPTIHPEYCGRIAFAKLTPGLKRRYDELVKAKKATGEMTDEEKKKYGIEVTKSSKQIVNEVIDKIKKGEIKDKRDVWNALTDMEESDDKKVKLLNFYLKLEGWDNFNKLFDKKKLDQVKVDW